MERRQTSEPTPEAELLLLLASPTRTDEASRAGLDACEDWGSLLELAGRHQVQAQLAVVAHRTGCVDRVDAPHAVRLRKMRTAAAVLDHAQVEHLARLLTELKAVGIPVMLIKGRGLAERLYDDPAERLSTDIDLLVHPADLKRAGDVLEKADYQPYKPNLFRARHFHIPYFCPKPGGTSVVELHWDLTFRDARVRFDTGSWWDRAVATNLRSGTVLIPPREEELVYVAYHALNRGTITIRDLADISRLRDHDSDRISWERVFRCAQKTGGTSCLRITFELCESLWRIPRVDLPGWLGRPNRKLRVASNLVSPRTVLDAGTNTWWPYRRILSWAAMPGTAVEARQLFAHHDGFRPQLRDGHEPDAGGRSFFKRALRVLTGLFCCLLPLRMFPATRDAIPFARRFPRVGLDEPQGRELAPTGPRGSAAREPRP
jgi:hypothetical protein